MIALRFHNWSVKHINKKLFPESMDPVYQMIPRDSRFKVAGFLAINVLPNQRSCVVRLPGAVNGLKCPGPP